MTAQSQSPSLHFRDVHLEERSLIDQQIVDLENKIQQLRCQRNSLLPVASLPPEIISQIFSLSLMAPNGKRRSTTLMPLIRVCRQWRGIALENPVLWAYIDRTVKEKCIIAFLERSKGAPLHISLLRPDVLDGTQAMSMLVSNFGRVVDLKLDMAREIPIICNLPASHLQSLVLENVPVPGILFSGQAPRLTHLEIVNCQGFTFDTIPLDSQITELRICRSKGLPDLQVKDCLAKLASMPRLQILMLEGIFPDPASHLQVELPQVNLPDLRRLHITNVTVPTWLPFITSITTTSRPILCLNGRFGLEDLGLYLRALSHAKIEAANSVSLQVSRDALTVDVFPESGACSNLAIKYSYHSITSSDLIQHLPLHTVQCLSIADIQTAQDIWSLCPNIRALRLTRASAAAFIKYIGGLEIPQDSQSRRLAVTNGEDSTLSVFSFLRSLALEDLVSTFLPPPEVIRSFHEYFKIRKELGVGLDRLVLKGVTTTRFDFLADCAGAFSKEKMI